MKKDDNGVLRAAYMAWNSAADFRAKRLRHKRYVYGDQWSDTVSAPGRGSMREDSMIILSGKKPIKNNLLRQLVKQIVGRYRMNHIEAGTYRELGDFASRNQLAELDSRMLEEFLISGIAVQRVGRGADGEVRIDNVDPRRFFVSATADPRGDDVEMVGMLHDMSLPAAINRFAQGNAARAEAIAKIYAMHTGDRAFSGESLGTLSPAALPFFNATEGRCRVIEVWTLDCRAAGPAAYHTFWHCRWLAPDGTVLMEHDSTLPHGGHPFAFKLYPLTDGEVHPFVEDVIDQQRYINRILVMIDHMMAAAAKGVLLFPLDQLPEGMDWQHVAECWAHADGVIPITGNGQHLPQQVVTQMAGSGVYQLLDMQLKLFENSSGVTDALLGRNLSGATGAQLYETQVRNASIALTDLLESFAQFTSTRNTLAALA